MKISIEITKVNKDLDILFKGNYAIIYCQITESVGFLKKKVKKYSEEYHLAPNGKWLDRFHTELDLKMQKKLQRAYELWADEQEEEKLDKINEKEKWWKNRQQNNQDLFACNFSDEKIPLITSQTNQDNLIFKKNNSDALIFKKENIEEGPGRVRLYGAPKNEMDMILYNDIEEQGYVN